MKAEQSPLDEALAALEECESNALAILTQLTSNHSFHPKAEAIRHAARAILAKHGSR